MPLLIFWFQLSLSFEFYNTTELFLISFLFFANQLDVLVLQSNLFVGTVSYSWGCTSEFSEF